MITPTVGRVVWYRPQEHIDGLTQHDPAQPMAAHVAYVWNDELVNLLVIDHGGKVHSRTSVPLIQEGGTCTAGSSPFCEWMPYQKGQAAKYEALEKEKKPTIAELEAILKEDDKSVAINPDGSVTINKVQAAPSGGNSNA
jgi:hypothetical protein